MKNILIKSLIISNMLFLYGCNDSKDSNDKSIASVKVNTYEQMVIDYLKSELNNPKSYEAVSFKNISDNPNLLLIKHEYRATNSYNALIKSSEYFLISKKDNKVLVAIQNRMADTFIKLLKNEYEDRNVDDFFTMIILNRATLLHRYDTHN